ncbi:MAG: alpha-L-fucosidase [Opitutales bacterium]
MKTLLCKEDYLQAIARTRDQRMSWWREARFGMFIHYGLYSQLGRNEWAMVLENMPVAEYEKLAATFAPAPGAPREWAKLARRAGMKYMVMTTRHHEGFSLWDSQANPYNSVNHGPQRDLVREFVDACREFDLRIGFYSSLMDWHHPDSWRCAFDSDARIRFNRYIEALNTELLTQYGKIDILWFDVARPMETWEGWNSVEMNQRLRALQPDLIINDRTWLPEDFSTPEEHLTATNRDWEACMTFNGISWGYVDSAQSRLYSYNAQRILKMLNTCCKGGGNLLLNIGPAPDGSVPPEAIEPLSTVGDWLRENGRAVYGRLDRTTKIGGNGGCDASCDGKSVYLWYWLWPASGEMSVGGYMRAPKAVRFLATGAPIEFTHDGRRIILKNLPRQPVDAIAGVTVIEMVFDGDPGYVFANRYPQLHGGKSYDA